MKRSVINHQILQAVAFFEASGWSLPRWAKWGPGDYAARPLEAADLRSHQMGWDVTDFGSGRFAERGLVLFCLRNGVPGRTGERPYAEKLMMVAEGQETPLHLHRAKMEDIINRGGGRLMIEFHSVDTQRQRLPDPIEVHIDGLPRLLEPGEPLRLSPGESVTVRRQVLHRFYAEPGYGTVLAGEVSQCNDDQDDNYFDELLGRFAAIEEDEPALFPLWNEVGAT